CRQSVSADTLYRILYLLFFVFTHPAPTEIYTLSLHDALPIFSTSRSSMPRSAASRSRTPRNRAPVRSTERNSAPTRSTRSNRERSEEHTSELQSRENLVCRLLLEKKKKTNQSMILYTTVLILI